MMWKGGAFIHFEPIVPTNRALQAVNEKRPQHPGETCAQAAERQRKTYDRIDRAIIAMLLILMGLGCAYLTAWVVTL